MSYSSSSAANNSDSSPPLNPSPTSTTSSSSAEAPTAAAAASTRRFRIYTRTGDKGTSALFTGERRAKDDVTFDALGTTDELSSHLGLAREFCADIIINISRSEALVDQENSTTTASDLNAISSPIHQLATKLEKVQCLLQDIGANIATPRNTSDPKRLAKTMFDVDGGLTAELENWIDELDNSLPPLRNFILPSGGKAASTLHIARSVCRRAERRVIPLVLDGCADASVGKYLNRLSDFLFTAARFTSLHEGRTETIYKEFKTTVNADNAGTNA